MVEKSDKQMNISKQCEVLSIHKSGLYYVPLSILHSRKALNWSVSNSMSADWGAETLKEVIEKYGNPEIFNTDQNRQFTSEVFINLLKENNIQISMDGKGRVIDNIFVERLWKSAKYEHIYLSVYENGLDLYQGLKKYFSFYNTERLHQSLDYKTTK